MAQQSHDIPARQERANSPPEQSAVLPAAAVIALPADALEGAENAAGDTHPVLGAPIQEPPVEQPPIEFRPLRPITAGETLDSLAEAAGPHGFLHRVKSAVLAPWLVSMVVHGWVLLVLALIIVRAEQDLTPKLLTASLDQDATEPERLETQPLPIQAPVAASDLPTSPQWAEEAIDVRLATGASQPAPSAPAALLPSDAVKLLSPVGIAGGGLQGRSEEARARLVKLRGGNPRSETAVTRGLRWLAAHQLSDGSWRLNHHLAPQCKGACRDPGNVGSTTAATALALLPFLGAGNTHLDGEYNEGVLRGLYYLGSRMVVSKRGGDLQEGTMYAQGLATLVFCEAYAMTGDEDLRQYAQLAVDFIVQAQHQAGGWRYLPGQPGDTTSLGWQLMALKSGQRAGLNVPPATFYAAEHFLDSVQTNGGAGYGYQSPERTPTMTAIGLLSRMYLGWPRQHEPLVRGVDFLAETGPSADSMYYNYYATQVLHHYEGPRWDAWNAQMRDYLVKTQATEGHEAGSWHFDDPHTKTAGRLYDTAMATMILEVYYRYLPLYNPQILDAGTEFPLGDEPDGNP